MHGTHFLLVLLAVLLAGDKQGNALKRASFYATGRVIGQNQLSRIHGGDFKLRFTQMFVSQRKMCFIFTYICIDMSRLFYVSLTKCLHLTQIQYSPSQALGTLCSHLSRFSFHKVARAVYANAQK